MMKNLLLLLATLAGLSSLAHAQTSTDLNEGCRLSYDNTSGVVSMSWWGRTGRTYFIQQSDDLIHWTYIPIIESGVNDVIEWQFSTTASSAFFRLCYSDIPTTDPANADFDGDGISNLKELQNGTDPLSASSNGTGVPDGWAAAYGLEPTADVTLNGTNHLLYGYDGANRLQSFTSPSTTPVGYILDAEGNVMTVSQ